MNFRWGPSSSNNSLPSEQRGLGTFVPVCHSSGAFFVLMSQVCLRGVLEFWDGNDEVNKFCFGSSWRNKMYKKC